MAPSLQLSDRERRQGEGTNSLPAVNNGSLKAHHPSCRTLRLLLSSLHAHGPHEVASSGSISRLLQSMLCTRDSNEGKEAPEWIACRVGRLRWCK